MKMRFSFVLFRTLRPKENEQMVRSVNLKSSLLLKLFLYVEKLTQVCRPPSAEFSLFVQELSQILGADGCRRLDDVLETQIGETLCELFQMSFLLSSLTVFGPALLTLAFILVCHSCRTRLGGLFGATESKRGQLTKRDQEILEVK